LKCTQNIKKFNLKLVFNPEGFSKRTNNNKVLHIPPGGAAQEHPCEGASDGPQ